MLRQAPGTRHSRAHTGLGTAVATGDQGRQVWSQMRTQAAHRDSPRAATKRRSESALVPGGRSCRRLPGVEDHLGFLADLVDDLEDGLAADAPLGGDFGDAPSLQNFVEGADPHVAVGPVAE